MDRREHEHDTARPDRFARSSRRRPIHLTLVFDTYCPWSHAVLPTLRRWIDGDDRVSVEVVHGSFYSGGRVRPIGEVEWLPSTIASVSALTDARFGSEFRELTADGSFVMDSGPAAIGFIALRSIAPDLALDLAEAMHVAFFHDGRSLSDPRTLASIARAHDISVARLDERLANPAIRRIAHCEAVRAADLGVTAYPAALLHVHGGIIPITTRLQTVDQLAATLREHEHLATGRLVTHD